MLAFLCLGALTGQISDMPLLESRLAYAVTNEPGQDLKPLCEASGVSWPPSRIRLLAFKEEKVLEVWVANQNGPFRRIITYAITAASGVAGPKRREGDLQVPEGIYRLTDLNPNSRFHLSVRVDYPNETDISNSKIERSEVGGDIMVHGNAVSIGCIAIGDEAIQRLYELIEKVPRARRSIIISPVDLRVHTGFELPDEETWVNDLYRELESELSMFPLDGNVPRTRT